MVDQLKQFLTPPTFPNEEDNRIAGILNTILLTLFVAGIVMIFVMVFMDNPLTIMTLVVAVLVVLVCYGLMRRGHLRLSSFIVLLMLICLVTFILYAGFGVHDPTILLLPVIIIIAGLILDTRLYVLFTGLTVLSVGGIIFLEQMGYVQNAIFTRDSKVFEFSVYAVILVITAVTVRLLVTNLNDNLSRAQKSEAHWRSLVKNAPDYIFHLQPDGTIDFLNSVMDQPGENIIGHKIYEMNHPDHHERVHDAINHVLTTGDPTSFESQARRGSGPYSWFSNRLGPIRQEGTIIGLTLFATNISERVEMEKALQSERDFAQRILDNMGQGLTITDENGRFIYVNQAYTHMTGYTVDALVGRTPYDLVTSEAYAYLEQQGSIRRAGETSSYQSQIQHANGHIVHVLITGVPRQKDGKYIGSIAVVTDLTEQMEAEFERERLIAELESRNSELERFTYTVSHDLKSPLITIRGFLGLLNRDLEQKNEAGVQQAIKYIDQAAGTMESLLRDLLELSRIGRIVNQPEETPFALIIEEALLRVSGQIGAYEIQIEVADNLPTVYVDRPRMVEVMQNLLDNAIKFSRDQVQPLVKVGVIQKDGESYFFVQDNGIGIDAKYHNKVFGLFERLDSSFEGTGVGLALVKRIIEVHNGRLWVESDGEGQGSTFYFTLPLTDTEFETGLS